MSDNLPKGQHVRRFKVGWRNVNSGRTSDIGRLVSEDGSYRFSYMPAAASTDGFRPLLGFSQFERSYHSTRLFPIFSQRVMHRRRPDFSGYLAALGLMENASDLDILSRVGGYRKADTIRVLEEPTPAPDGTLSQIFFVPGVRYANDDFGMPAPRPGAVRAGDILTVEPQPDNPINQQALRLISPTGEPVGWIPELLLTYLQVIPPVVTKVRVLRVNGGDVPPYLRVLAQLTGRAQ